ncbi:MAG: glycosyl hydrolase [Pricia sp.]
MKKKLFALLPLVAAFCLMSWEPQPRAERAQIIKNTTDDPSFEDLYTKFKNPPAEARPFVRWWWNGNKIEEGELDRQLELLKEAGFGGVEINPIAMPEAHSSDMESLVWMSDAWIDMVVHACKKTKDLGMIADIIAGTGWPFGGEFLKDDETCQRVVTDTELYHYGDKIEVSETSLIASYKNKYQNNGVEKHNSDRTSYRLSHISLVPINCKSIDEVIDLGNSVDDSGNLSYTITSPGDWYLSYGLIQQNFRDVYLGAPGGAGPVMDHYRREMTLAYLERMKKITERSGIPLSDLVRALFCDSIEVAGANWSDGFSGLFFNTYGYKLEPWMSFVFYEGHRDYSKSTYFQNFEPEFKDKLKRVRFDYNNLLVNTFLENFTQAYKDFCEANNILCRYQAYGVPFLMGMLDGYMIPDIPESNNWIYTAKMKDSLWNWNQSHGYMIWNLYASAGAHLSGKKIASCESMTNLDGVFKTSLEEIKQHDDMNFITGMNHTILHGYNYSPKEATFPGWIRYGAYFSERNTWWKHLPQWIDYNARLSSVFQNSQAEKSIAILGPTADLWGEKGLVRGPFHTEPEYLYRMWEPISQLGYSSEYINQSVLSNANVNEGSISFGDMNYRLLVLADVESLDLKAAKKLETYIVSGGQVVVIGKAPDRSPGFKAYKQNDKTVRNIMKRIQSEHPQSFVRVHPPSNMGNLLTWTKSFLESTSLSPDVVLSEPSEKVYQIHQVTDNEEVYFFTNVHRYDSASFTAKFPIKGKYPYHWNPETGERTPYPYNGTPGELEIDLQALESLLLIFEDEKPTSFAVKENGVVKNAKKLDTKWEVIAHRVDGEDFNWSMDELIDFGNSKDSTQNTFAGEIKYRTTVDLKANSFTHIDLGDTNEGITELYINDKKIGKRWYGEAVYPISDFLKEGKNSIEIRYTTVLANYCLSLDNEMVNTWTERYENHSPVSTGLEGPVKLLRKG